MISGLSLKHFSYQALQTASWHDLEQFAVETLKNYYKPFGLTVSRTEKASGGQTGGDGARDGEATYVFANSKEKTSLSALRNSVLTSELGIVITLWVEVKQRSHRKVDHNDVGGTILNSSLEHVTKVVFVTNSSFTALFQDQLARYTLQNGMQFALIDGKRLIKIAEEVTKKDKTGKTTGVSRVSAPSSARITSHIRFTRDPAVYSSETKTSKIELPAGEPIFLIGDFLVEDLDQSLSNLDISLHYAAESSLSIMPRIGNIQHAVRVGDRFRAEFAILPEKPGKLYTDKFVVSVHDDRGQNLSCQVVSKRDVCEVRGTILPNWIPPSRASIYSELCNNIEGWLNSSGVRAADVIAIAGAGKSHLVRQTRVVWLRKGAFEMFLDGSKERTTNEAALSILGQLFPIPMDELSESLARSLSRWLKRSGISESQAESLAQFLCDPSKKHDLPFSDEQLGRFLALMIAARSELRPIILVFEDLHKCSPSVITLLQSLRQNLAANGRGNIFTLFTTREDSVWNDEAIRNKWRFSMESMRIGNDVAQIRVVGFERSEAQELIKHSIPTIEDYYAEKIIDQVGTTPFAIREAMGLLIERAALKSTGKNGIWSLVDPERLRDTLYSQDLRRATHYRLRGLLERYPDWLADFMDSGACIGPLFDLETCAQNAKITSLRQLEKALQECFLLEILRTSPFSFGSIQFDHDLVRQVLLQDIGSLRQRRLAKGLFALLEDKESPGLLASLCYQAGLADECWSYSLKRADSAGEVKRHLEAVNALGLALTVTDNNVAAKIFDVRGGRYRPSFDEAIAVAEPSLRSGLDREGRERETARLLVRYVEHLVAVGSSGTPSVSQALSEGGMLAEKLKDQVIQATITLYHGRQEFNRDRPLESLALHKKADEIFARVEPTRESNRLRTQNLVRMAIAFRAIGKLDESRKALIRAIKGRFGQNWTLATQVRGNFGATYFYIDLNKTRHHWQRAVDIAKRLNLTDRYVHSLIDVATLDLLEDKEERAERSLNEAYDLSRNYGLENSELRCFLNLGCLALMRGEPLKALDLLRDADRLGFRHGIGRRLWRVRSNMATAYFILGDKERSLSTDQIVLESMVFLQKEISTEEEKNQLFRTRIVFALTNIVLRAKKSKAHQKLLQSFPYSAAETANDLAQAVIDGRLTSAGRLLHLHQKKMGKESFFVITE